MAKFSLTGSSSKHMGFASNFEDVHPFALRKQQPFPFLPLLLLPAPKSYEEGVYTHIISRTVLRFVDT